MDAFTLALTFGGKLLDKIPDYDQTKKNKFFKDSKRYLEEKSKAFPLRDDDLILNLKDELTAFMDAFNKELSK